ncbi:MAG: hypothetical protein NUV41_16145 [Eubacteriales bacterium]|jgi:hypothetical protein|nr:hypothetical protein [Eubacteriales bacterium]
MGDAPLHFKLNMKTGFFKSEPYIVTVTDEAITFVRNRRKTRESKKIISCADVKSIAIFERSPAELEVRTEKEVLIGILQEPVDAAKVSEVLQAMFGMRFWRV